MSTAYLSMGSNIGNAQENLHIALDAIDRIPQTKLSNVSQFYITAPIGYVSQNDFTNICVCVETQLPAQALLGACLGIEAVMGRLRPFKNSPRIIDIDLLLYDDIVSNTAFLTLPHPRMFERAFVLVPLNEIIPDELKMKYRIAEMLEKTASQRLTRLI